MSNDLTPAEARFVRALCTGGPLGITAIGLSRALGVTTATVGNLAGIVERKGFCTRERYGMRVFLRPTTVALAFAAPATVEELASGAERCPSMRPRKARRPRAPQMR